VEKGEVEVCPDGGCAGACPGVADMPITSRPPNATDARDRRSAGLKMNSPRVKSRFLRLLRFGLEKVQSDPKLRQPAENY
jgi:hypothetical protein